MEDVSSRDKKEAERRWMTRWCERGGKAEEGGRSKMDYSFRER